MAITFREVKRLLRRSEHFDGFSYFYNLDNNRDDDQVKRELKAMIQDKPHTIDLVETIGNRLPEFPGYTLLHDKSTKSRANVAAYVRNDLDLSGPWYDDHEETWARTKASGEHEARSTLYYMIGWMQCVVAHQGPKYTNNTRKVQQEGVDRIAAKMAPWKKIKSWNAKNIKRKIIQRLRPRKLAWDSNARKGESGPGPDMLAKRIGGEVHGRWIDNVVVRNVKILSIVTVNSVRRIRLRSDHKHALAIRWRVPLVWMKKN